MADILENIDSEDMDEVPGRIHAKPCQPCHRKNDNNVAEVYCEDCLEYQCKECAKVHQHFPVIAAHKLINISNTEYASRRYDMKGLDICKQHGEILTFLCEDDNKLCCSICASFNHRNCESVVEIKEKTKMGGPAIITLNRVLLNMKSKTKTFQQFISEQRQLLVKGETEILDKIRDMQDKVHKMFEELKTKASHDISTFKKQITRDLDTKVASCASYVADVEQYLSDIENVTELGTPSQQMIIFHYLKDQVPQLQQNTTKIMEEFKGIRMNFEFDECLKLPTTRTAMPGRLTLEYLTISDSRIDSKEKQHKEQKVHLKLLSSIDLKQGEGDAEEPLYSGLDFLPDRRLVAVDNMNTKCVVYNEQLQPVASFALSKVPQDVVAVSEDKVAVTTGGARIVHFLEILDNHEISLKESMNVTLKYESISVIDNEHFVVGTIDNPQPVRILSVSGEERELGFNFPTKMYPLSVSNCTYIQNCNKVVLSDRCANTVYIYDIGSNTRVEVKEEKIIMEPRGVAVGICDCVFVCSKETNTLVQISHTGQILSSHVLDMWYPCSVSVSKDNTKLAVSNMASGELKLQLYSIESQ